MEVFEELIFEFRQSFPKDGSRVDGVNYFDDLIQQLISKYNKHKKGGENSKRLPDPAIEGLKELIKKLGHTTIAVDSLFALAEGHNLVYSKGRIEGKAVTKAWIKKHLKKFKIR